MSWLPSSSEQTSYQYSHHNSANHMRGGMCRHALLGFFKELGDSVDKLATSPILLLWGRVFERNVFAPASLLVGSGLTCGIGHSRCEAETSWCRLQLARYDGILG